MPALDRTRSRGFVDRRSADVGPRWHAAMLVLALLGSSLLGLAHESAVRHVRCAEHGELIHGNPAASSASIAARTAHDEVLRALPGAVARDHDHCSLASAMRELRLAPRALVLIAPLAVDTGEVVAVARTTAPSRHLYRTAPKTSPPA